MPLTQIQQAILDASRVDDVGNLKVLLEQNPTLNLNYAEGDGGYSPLLYAADERCLDNMRALIERGADINFFPNASGEHQTPIVDAAIEGEYEMIEILLRHNADPNFTGIRQDTAILSAALHDHFDIVRLLANNHADVNVKIEYSMSYTLCLGLERISIPTKETSLHFAASKGDNETILVLLKHHARINEQDSLGWTAFARAALANHYGSVALLACYNADCNLPFDNNMTPLHSICRKENIAMAKLLIFLGANLDIKNSDGETALFSCLRTKNLELFNLILESGANLNIRNAIGNTILHEVASYGDEYIDMLQVLISKPQLNFQLLNDNDKTAFEVIMQARQFNSDKYQKTFLCLQPFYEKNVPVFPGMSQAFINPALCPATFFTQPMSATNSQSIGFTNPQSASSIYKPNG